MAAPKGNKFYMNRQKDGRELVFSTPELLLTKAYDYFKWCEKTPLKKQEVIKGGTSAGKTVNVKLDRPYTIIGFCVYGGISLDTFSNYEKRKDFLGVITHIREVIQQNQIEGALVGNYNCNIISRMLGLADKQEIDIPTGLTINVSSQKTKEKIQDLEKNLKER